MKRILAMLLTAAMLISVFPTAFAESDEVEYSKDNTTWTASSLADAVSAIGTGTGTIKVLKDITLTSGIAVKGKITIDAKDKNVTITRGFANGTETSFSDAGDSMFSVYNGATGPDANLTLGSKDNTYTLTIDGNKSTYGDVNKGSVIYSSGASGKPANVTLYNNVTLQNNKTAEEGGAIYSYSYANISVYGAKFLNNETTKNGGAIAVYNNNTYNDSLGNKMVIENAEFKNNAAKEDGGAVHIGYGGTKVNIKNSSFTENSAQIGSAINAGSIACYSSSGLENAFVLDGCSFENNKYNNQEPQYTTMGAYTYNVDSTIYLEDPSKFVDKSIVLKGKNKFSNSTASDLALECYSYGSNNNKPVIYLDNSFELDSTDKVKVMVGAYGVSGTKGYNIFKYSSGSADFTSMFTLARDKWNSCNAVDKVTFAANTSNNGLIIVEKTEPEVQYMLDGGSTWQDSTLSAAVTAIGSGKGTIKVLKDIELSAKIDISGDITMIAGDSDVTIKRASTLTAASLVEVKEGATLTLGTEEAMSHTLTFDGGAVWDGGHPNEYTVYSTIQPNNKGTKAEDSLVTTYGTINMYANVVMQNNHNNNSYFGANMEHKGSGVYIGKNGVFNMHGGTIQDNSCASQGETGGGVAISSTDDTNETPAVFNMYGGEICYNTAGTGGGVCVSSPNDVHSHEATFNMHGGEIKNNTASVVNATGGGGVFVGASAIFNMENGTIQSNKASSDIHRYESYGTGGGVGSIGTFKMSGGTITKNEGLNGAGVFLNTSNGGDASTADISGGSITENSGIGIFVYSKTSNLNISGNVNISGNTYTGIYIEGGTDSDTELSASAAPINISAALTCSNVIDVDSGLEDDGTVIVTADSSLNISDYASQFKHKTKSLIEQDNKLVIGTAKHSVTVTDPIYMKSSFEGFPDSKIGTISVTGADNLTAVPAGTELTLAVTLDTTDNTPKNHTFVKWVVKTASGGDVTVTDDKFTMPGEDVTVTAEYVPDITMTFYAGNQVKSDECEVYVWNSDDSVTYTMPDGKGTLTISKTGGFKKWTYLTDTTQTPTVTANDTVTVTVNTNGGYVFGGIKSVKSQNGKLTGTYTNEGTYTFNVPTGTYENYGGFQAADIVLDITRNAFGITVAPCENGTVTTNPTGSANVGQEVTVTAAPDANYVLDTITVTKESGGAVTVTGGKFTMPDEAVTVKATFKKEQYTLKNATTEERGTVTITKDDADVNNQKLDWGTPVTVTVTPELYWEIDKITIDGEDISKFTDTSPIGILSTGTPVTYTVLIPKKDSELVVTYKKEQFNVTADGIENGTITLLSTSPIDWGNNFTINVTADAHYEIDTVTVDGSTVTVDSLGDYTFEMPTHDVSVSATFKKVKYRITGSGENVTFGIPSTDAYDWGDTVTVTVTPNTWYTVKSVSANNDVTLTPVAGEDNKYSFVMPQSNVIITAVAERPNFSVTFNSKGGSAVTAKVVANGDCVPKPEVPVWANRGFAGWYKDEACTQKYDFSTPVTDDTELYARWFRWGDVNNDGVVDSADALLIRRCLVGLTDYSYITNRFAGFVNGFEEGRSYPDSGDALAIRRFCVGLINRYRVEDSAAGYEFDFEQDMYIPKN